MTDFASSNRQASRASAVLRDALLPRPLSGELDADDYEPDENGDED